MPASPPAADSSLSPCPRQWILPPPCLTQGCWIPPSPCQIPLTTTATSSLALPDCPVIGSASPGPAPFVGLLSGPPPGLPVICLCVCSPSDLGDLRCLQHWLRPPLLTASTLPLMTSIRPAKNRKMAPYNDKYLGLWGVQRAHVSWRCLPGGEAHLRVSLQVGSQELLCLLDVDVAGA